MSLRGKTDIVIKGEIQVMDSAINSEFFCRVPNCGGCRIIGRRISSFRLVAPLYD